MLMTLVMLILTTAPAQSGRPIDAMAAEAIQKELIVDASVADVWAAWTTNDGARLWLAQDTMIGGALGSPYEVYFLLTEPYGARGCEGCRIHALDPLTRLAFTWSAPPQFRTIRQPGLMTIVDLRFEPVGPSRTRVRLTQYGWGSGGEWDAVRAYFESAWDIPLGRLKYRFSTGPVDWARPPAITESFRVPAGGTSRQETTDR